MPRFEFCRLRHQTTALASIKEKTICTRLTEHPVASSTRREPSNRETAVHLRPKSSRLNRPALCGCASSGADVGCYGGSRFTDYSLPCWRRFCCLVDMSLAS